MFLGGNYTILLDNLIINNSISMSWGINNSLSGNIFIFSGIYMYGSLEELSSHIIDTTNLVNGNPLYFYANEIALDPLNFTNAGQVILVNCSDSQMENLNISQTMYAISLLYSNNITLSECNFSSNKIGLYVSSCKNISFFKSYILKNTYNGIDIFTSNLINIYQNTIKNNLNYGIYLQESYNNYISDNQITFNEENGIKLDDCEENIIKENIIENNYGDGIELINSDNNEIIENDIINNENWGIHLGKYGLGKNSRAITLSSLSRALMSQAWSPMMARGWRR